MRREFSSAQCAILLGACLFAGRTLQAQPAAEMPRVMGSAELSLINLDVVVTDKDGKPVEGLTLAEFEVFHGKKPVTITNFREERPGKIISEQPLPARTPRQEAATAPTPAEALTPLPPEESPIEPGRPRRHLVVFIDHLALPDEREREEVFGALRGILRKSIDAGDEAMVVSWRWGVQRVQPFTSDLAALERALDAASGKSVRIGGEQMEIDKLAADDAAYAWAGTGDSRMSRNLDAMQVWADVKAKAAALRSLMGIMAGFEGRKAMILASRTFSRQAGQEFGAGIDTRSLLESVTEAANAAGVTIHSLYAAAWEADLPTTATSRFRNPRAGGQGNLSRSQTNWMNEMTALGKLSEETGGVLIGNTSQAPLFGERVVADLSSWYSLGYPVPEGASKTSAVSVRVKRPGLTVRTRHSVVERSPEEQMRDRVLANLFRPDINARLPIAVSMKPVIKDSKKKFRTPVTVRIPAKHIVMLPGSSGLRGAVSVFYVSAESAGTFSEIVRERHEFAIPAGSEGLQATTVFNVDFDVTTATPAARISLGVWDETSRDAGFRLLRTAGP